MLLPGIGQNESKHNRNHSRIETVVSEHDLLFGRFLLISGFSSALDHSAIQYRSKERHDSVKGKIRFNMSNLFS